MNDPASNRSGPLLPDDALPPVEAPDAGFILQLFIIPAAIVGTIVLVWLLFFWLAHKDENPYRIVESLKEDNESRWLRASSLADMLRTPGNRYVRDPRLAEQLSEILTSELKTPTADEDTVRFRGFLCRALGEFEIPEAAGALLAAATLDRNDPGVDEAELKIRRSALEALAVLAENMGGDELRRDPKVLPVLLGVSRDSEWGIRSGAAISLGSLGGDEAESRLVELLDDTYPNVRFNAAIGLARRGNSACIDVLAEMLDPAPIGQVEEKDDVPRRLTSGLQATSVMFAQDPSADYSMLVAAIQQLERTAPTREVRIRAEELLNGDLAKIAAVSQ